MRDRLGTKHILIPLRCPSGKLRTNAGHRLPSVRLETVDHIRTADSRRRPCPALQRRVPDRVKPLSAVRQMGLEGTVSKSGGQTYQSGRNFGWVKVKTPEWKATFGKRFEHFQKQSPRLVFRRSDARGRAERTRAHSSASFPKVVGAYQAPTWPNRLGPLLLLGSGTTVPPLKTSALLTGSRQIENSGQNGDR